MSGLKFFNFRSILFFIVFMPECIAMENSLQQFADDKNDKYVDSLSDDSTDSLVDSFSDDSDDIEKIIDKALNSS